MLDAMWRVGAGKLNCIFVRDRWKFSQQLSNILWKADRVDGGRRTLKIGRNRRRRRCKRTGRRASSVT